MRSAIVFLLFISLITCAANKSAEQKASFKPRSAKYLENPEIEKVILKSAEGKLKLAKRSLALGNYKMAVTKYLEIYNAESYDTESRSQALYELGKIYHNSIYKIQDPDKALLYLNKLLGEFPVSSFRLEAYRLKVEIVYQLENNN